MNQSSFTIPAYILLLLRSLFQKFIFSAIGRSMSENLFSRLRHFRPSIFLLLLFHGKRKSLSLCSVIHCRKGISCMKKTEKSKKLPDFRVIACRWRCPRGPGRRRRPGGDSAAAEGNRSVDRRGHAVFRKLSGHAAGEPEADSSGKDVGDQPGGEERFE